MCDAFQNRKEEERTLIYLNEDSSVSSPTISVISKFMKLNLFHNTEERVFILKEVGEA